MGLRARPAWALGQAVSQVPKIIEIMQPFFDLRAKASVFLIIMFYDVFQKCNGSNVFSCVVGLLACATVKECYCVVDIEISFPLLLCMCVVGAWTVEICI